MEYITIRIDFNASGEEARLLLSTAWLFKLAVHRVLEHAKQIDQLPATKIGWLNTFKEIAYETIPNRRYAYSTIILVMSIYESCRHLGIDFRQVELSDWLMFQQSEKEYPPRNITIKSLNEVHVTVFDYKYNSKRIKLKISVSNNYRRLIEAILKEKQPYCPRIYINSWNIRDGTLYVSGELQIAVPLDFYYKYMARYRENKGRLYAGVDVNTDRINLAIVDRFGRLRDVMTFWFREVTARGFPRERAWSIIGEKIHEMLDYVYHQGVKTLFLEDSEVLGKLRLIWIKQGERKSANYNWRVSTFRSSIIERIALKAPLYAMNVKFVDPKGTTHSKEHDEIMIKFGLDRHTTSAYLIALRGLNITP